MHGTVASYGHIELQSTICTDLRCSGVMHSYASVPCDHAMGTQHILLITISYVANPVIAVQCLLVNRVRLDATGTQNGTQSHNICPKHFDPNAFDTHHYVLQRRQLHVFGVLRLSKKAYTCSADLNGISCAEKSGCVKTLSMRLQSSPDKFNNRGSNGATAAGIGSSLREPS